MSEIPEYEDCPRCDGKRAFEKGKGYTHCVWCEVIDLQKELEQVKGLLEKCLPHLPIHIKAEVEKWTETQL